MPLQLSTALVALVLTLCLQWALCYSNTRFEALSFTYTASDIIETVTTSSKSQCAISASLNDACVAMEYQEDHSTCDILKSATWTAEVLNMKQYSRALCQEGWGRFAGSCYFVTSTEHKFDDCKTICTNYGNSHLVTVTSDEESAFVLSFKQGVVIFTGGKLLTLGDGDSGMWGNGETWGYTNWGDTQPNNFQGNQECIRFAENWDDVDCELTVVHCMCEKALL